MADPSPHHARYHRHHRHHHHHIHAPAPAAHAVANAVVPPTVPTPWWDRMTDAERIIAIIHDGLSSLWTSEIMPQHNAPPLARRAGIEPLAATGAHRLGGLSMFYETGCHPGQEGKAAATVSSGRGDAGGKSYGAYQFNSTTATGAVVKTFLAATEGSPWAAGFIGLDPVLAGAFETEWKRIAAAQPAEFFTAQHKFIERTHYRPVVAKVLKETKVDVDLGGAAVRDVVWSISVQHGRAARLVAASVRALAGQGHPGEKAYDRLLIVDLYARRAKYVTDNGIDNLASILARYKSEEKEALAMLNTVGAGGPP